MAPLSLIYRKIDKKTEKSHDVNASLNLSKIDNNLKLPNLIADRQVSHEITKKRDFSDVNKSNIFLESINSNNNLKRSNNFFTSKLRENIRSKNYQPLVPVHKKGYMNLGAKYFKNEYQNNINPKKERPIAFGVEMSKSNDRSSSIDSNDHSDPNKVKSKSNTSRVNSGSERSDSLNKNQHTGYLNQVNNQQNNQQKEIYRVNNKYNGKADRVSFAKDIYQILSQDTKKEILSSIREFVKGENLKEESLTNFLKLFINGLYYAYNQPSYLKIRFQPQPINMPNSNSDYKKTLFIEPFYVFALLEDHMTS